MGFAGHGISLAKREAPYNGHLMSFLECNKDYLHQKDSPRVVFRRKAGVILKKKFHIPLLVKLDNQHFGDKPSGLGFLMRRDLLIDFAISYYDLCLILAQTRE